MSEQSTGAPRHDPQRREQIQMGLERVRERIDEARRAAGRGDRVDLVVVTKTFPATDVAILAGLGVTDVAENRVQVASAKWTACASTAPGLRWHMIGRLQRNKASSVAQDPAYLQLFGPEVSSVPSARSNPSTCRRICERLRP